MGLAMGVEWNASHCTMLFKLLLPLVLSSSLTMTRAATRRQANTDLSSAIINITECSVPQLGFTLMEPLDGKVVYTFLAVCKVNAECMEGILRPGPRIQPTVGSTFQLGLHTSSCSLSNTLTPRGTGLCTLLLSTSNVFHDSSGTAFMGICTLSSSSGSSSSTSVQTTGNPQLSSSLLVQPSSNGTLLPVQPSSNGTLLPGSVLPTPVIVATIAVTVLLLAMTFLLIVAIASLLIWMRHSRTRSQGTPFN